MRHKDANWDLPDAPCWDSIKTGLLMDLRDELKAIRIALLPLRHLECSNFLAIPAKLDQVVKNTTKKRRTRKKKVV